MTKTVRIVDKPCISIEERAEMQAKFDRWLECQEEEMERNQPA